MQDDSVRVRDGRSRVLSFRVEGLESGLIPTRTVMGVNGRSHIGGLSLQGAGVGVYLRSSGFGDLGAIAGVGTGGRHGESSEEINDRGSGGFRRSGWRTFRMHDG